MHPKEKENHVYKNRKADNSGYGAKRYFIDEEYQGRGYATEALLALFEWGIAVSDLPYFILTIDCANTASCRVAEKAGFQLYEKRFPINHKQANMISDCYFYYRKYR